ncbi:MAG: hypothetical protein ACPG4N_05855 [Gammaproteobacteria bacterium]
MSEILDDGKLAILGTTTSRGISAKQLDGMLSRHLPADAEILIVFAQCYGGNMASSKFFRQRAGTCVLSGTNPGQEAGYAGYHDDAARSLKPGKGRTAATVHEGGQAGLRELYPEGSEEAKIWNEEPLISGALAPEDFSLESVDGENILARQLLIYSARPETEYINTISRDSATIPMPGKGNEVRVGDEQDRERLIANFEGQANTQIRCIGGEADPAQPDRGVKGWDAPGTQTGLEAHIKSAGATLAAAEGSGKKQFILFVGDHGIGTRRLEFGQAITVKAGDEAVLETAFPPFEEDSANIASLKRCKEATPCFELIVEVPTGFDPTSGLALPIAPDALELKAGGVTAKSFEWTYEEGAPAASELGENPNSIRLVFAADRKAFLGLSAAGNLSISLVNTSTTDLVVTGIVQATGAVNRSMGPLKGILPSLLGGWFWHMKA